MADVHGSPAGEPQAPSAPGPGPAPVPYAGAVASEPPPYGLPPLGDAGGATSAVMAGVSGHALQESGYAHDLNAGLVTPYAPGSPSAIYVGGDSDPGGRDDVAGTVGGAVASAEARFHELAADTYPQGSTLGDVMNIPVVPANAQPNEDQPGLMPFQGDEPPSVS